MYPNKWKSYLFSIKVEKTYIHLILLNFGSLDSMHHIYFQNKNIVNIQMFFKYSISFLYILYCSLFKAG